MSDNLGENGEPPVTQEPQSQEPHSQEPQSQEPQSQEPAKRPRRTPKRTAKATTAKRTASQNTASQNTAPTPTIESVTKPPRNRRRAALIGLRVAAGTVGIGVAVVAIAAAGLVPFSSIRSIAPSLVVSPVPATEELVCSGAVLRLGDEFGQDATSPKAVGAPVVSYGTTGIGVDTMVLTSSDAGTGGTPSAPLRLSANPPEESTPPDEATSNTADDPPAAVLLSGASAQAPSEPEFTGLAASSCQGAASETWLVGGSTDVGRTTLLTLANPSDVASTVAIEIFSEDGEIVSAGATGIMVQPLGHRVLSLSGFAPSIDSPVIRVTSRGGQVVARLQQATVRGLDAGGVDIIGVAAQPASIQVIPGVVVNRAQAVRESRGAQSFEDMVPVVRLLIPGVAGASVNVTIVPDGVPVIADSDHSADNGADTDNDNGTDNGTGTGTDAEDVEGEGRSFSVELTGGQVTDVPVEKLADGVYTVIVSSEQPVIAGARISSVSELSSGGAVSGSATRRPASSDFAWFAPARILTTDSIVTIAEGPAPELHLHNPTTENVTVILATTDGNERPVFVAAGTSASTAVTAGSTVMVRGFPFLYASVSFVGDAQLASYPVHPPAAGSAPISVYPE